MPEADDMPDFIIVGAMKSGTSSMRWILSSRRDVFIPDRELHFFTMGDPIQFTETVKFHPERIRFDLDDEKKTEWYKSFFEAAHSDQLIGEDSTSYLPSQVAPKRIRKLLPDVKLIFMLRDPVERTYSHYRHLLMAGHVTKSFEQELIRAFASPSPELLQAPAGTISASVSS